MSTLQWVKPPRVMSSEERAAISADSAPPGVYTPNMSDEDMLLWKAKLIGGRTDQPRVEIRKTTARGTQVVLAVYLNGVVKMSMNGKATFCPEEWQELAEAVSEARERMRLVAE